VCWSIEDNYDGDFIIPVEEGFPLAKPMSYRVHKAEDGDDAKTHWFLRSPRASMSADMRSPAMACTQLDWQRPDPHKKIPPRKFIMRRLGLGFHEEMGILL
jgi:hypothetical protein